MRNRFAAVVPVVSIARVTRASVALAACVGLVLSCGCAGKNWTTLGWFPAKPPEGSAANEEVKHVAPASGVYKVKFATRPSAGPDDFHTYGGACRIVHQGDYVGFARDASGQLYAIAGDETFPLPERKRARRTPNYLVWAYHAPEQVKSGLSEALDGIGQALVVTAVVVGIASLVLLGIWEDLHCHHGAYDSCEE